jgi:outer membrane receptor for monomeric catechols
MGACLPFVIADANLSLRNFSHPLMLTRNNPNRPSMNFLSFTFFTLIAFFGLASLPAQTLATPTPTPTNALLDIPLEDLVKMEIPLNKQFVPTARPISSLYGFDYTTLEIPRSVSLLTRAQFEQRAIQSITDLGQFSPGTYTPVRFGVPATPVIRGQLGEIYQDGLRKRFNRNGFPTSFNATETLEIVKGPQNVLQSPGVETGGFINLVSKQPYYDHWHGEIRNTLGRYVPGGNSYFRDEWNLDFGGPLYQDILGLRVSYLGRESDSFYRNAKDDTQDIYVALGYKPYEKLKIDLRGQYYSMRFNEIIGVNRPTQDLINNRNYITGTYAAGPGFGTIAPATQGLSKIYPDQVLIAPQDSANAAVGNASLRVEMEVDENLKLINNTYGETIERSKESAYTYTEYLPESITVENRSEAQLKFETGLFAQDWQHEIVTGASQRYERTKGYVEFFSEFFNAYDLTLNPSTFTAGASTATSIPGTNLFANSTNGAPDQTVESDLINTGLFYQHKVKFDDKWSVLGGLRGDLVHAASKSLLVATPYEDQATVLNPAWQLSLMYAPVERSLIYLNYQRATSYDGAYAHSGIGFQNAPSQKINPERLRVESDLYEIGFKHEIIKTQLFVSADLFYQKKYGIVRDRQIHTQVRGLELEATYQPNESLSLISNFTFQQTRFVDYNSDFAASTAKSGDFLRAAGSPNFAAFRGTGDFDVPGTPEILYNSFAIYTHSSGFGAGLGPQVQGEQSLNLAGDVIIPAQFTWNATVFYKQPRWTAKLDIFNFTDERNFTPVENVFTSNDLVYTEMPLSIQGTIAYRF